MKPRDYQLESVDACHEGWQTDDALLIVLPTGTGKTVVFVLIAGEWQVGRVLIIAPRIELVSQAAKKLCKHTGIMPAIEQAENRSNESEWGRSPFIVASKDTLLSGSKEKRRRDKHGVMQTIPAQKRYERLEDIGLVIVDEAHEGLTPAFKEVIDHFRRQGAKVLGVTATPKRHDKKALGNIYQRCVYNMGIAEAIDGGWLVPPVSHCLQLKSLDLSEVNTYTKADGSKDFNAKQLAKALETEKVIYEIAELTAAESRGLKTVVYCESIDQARRVAALLADQHGYKAEYISSKCTKDKRQAVLESFTEDPDGVSIVCNVGILTTGWDFPALQHIVIARPTKSLPLYTQMIGRGTRPLEGVVDFEGSTPELRKKAIAHSEKPSFKLTDLRDNSMQHKLVTAVDVLGGEMGLSEEVDALLRKLMERSEQAASLMKLIEEAKDTVAAEITEAIIYALERATEAKTVKQVKAARALLTDAIKRAKAALAGDDRAELRELLEKANAEQEEFERREREALAARKAKAEYERRKVDPFDESQRGNVVTSANGDTPVMKFGKHKGTPMAEVPTDYLAWVVGASSLPWPCKGPCKAELNRRKNHHSPAPAKHKPQPTPDVQKTLANFEALLMEI